MIARSRKVFTNERGNRIVVEARRGPAPDEITLHIEGPTSAITNTVTEMEAWEICAAITEVSSKELRNDFFGEFSETRLE